MVVFYGFFGVLFFNEGVCVGLLIFFCDENLLIEVECDNVLLLIGELFVVFIVCE